MLLLLSVGFRKMFPLDASRILLLAGVLSAFSAVNIIMSEYTAGMHCGHSYSLGPYLTHQGAFR